MATPAEIADRKPNVMDERGEVIRLFLAVFCLDSEADAEEVSVSLGIEDTHALWALAQRAQAAIE